MAFFKQHGSTPPTYESCSTAIFKYGRTETLRSATMETKRFCELLESKIQPSKQDLRKALSDCSNVHVKLAAEATMGKQSMIQEQQGISLCLKY